MSIELDTEIEQEAGFDESLPDEMPNAFSEAHDSHDDLELPDVPVDNIDTEPDDDVTPEPDDTKQEEKTNDVPRETLPEITKLPDDWKFPDYLDKQYVPPESFKDEKEEVEWFRKNYRQVIDYHSSEEHVKTLAEKYQDFLIEKEGKVEELKAVQQMLDDDPYLAFKLYAPQVLTQLGAEHKLSDSDIAKLTKEQMSKEFGIDYQKVYSPTDSGNPDTISGRMFNRQQEIRQNLEKLNTEIDEKIKSVKLPTPEERQEIVDKQYEDFKEDFTREEYDSFVKEADEYVKAGKLSYLNLHTVMKLNDYLETAYERGVADGKKSLTEDLEKAGSEKIDHRPVSTKNGKPVRKIVFDERNPWGTEKLVNPFM